MAAKHGTRRRYIEGSRCEDCIAANTAYQHRWRQGRTCGEPSTPNVAVSLSPVTAGPVESGVQAEIAGLAAEARPGLAAIAISLAQLMDDPKARNQQPAAAKVLSALLDKLHRAGAQGRRGNLAVVRARAATDE